jgi:sugar lactone lactonase YvrE
MRIRSSFAVSTVLSGLLVVACAPTLPSVIPADTPIPKPSAAPSAPVASTAPLAPVNPTSPSVVPPVSPAAATAFKVEAVFPAGTLLALRGGLRTQAAILPEDLSVADLKKMVLTVNGVVIPASDITFEPPTTDALGQIVVKFTVAGRQVGETDVFKISTPSNKLVMWGQAAPGGGVATCNVKTTAERLIRDQAQAQGRQLGNIDPVAIDRISARLTAAFISSASGDPTTDPAMVYAVDVVAKNLVSGTPVDTFTNLDRPSGGGGGGGGVAVVAPTPWRILALAGTTAGLSGDGAAATAAQLNRPSGLAVDGAGNVYCALEDNHRVRVVCNTTGNNFGEAMTAGNIYTVAGSTLGLSGDGAAATAAQLRGTLGVAFDATGNLFIADSDNHRVRVVCKTTGTYFGVAMTANNIYTVAGTNAGLSGDAAAANAAQLTTPSAVGFDADGNIVISDSTNHRVRVVCKTTGNYFGVAMTANNIYTVAGTTAGLSGDGAAATAAQLNSPWGAAVDGTGNLYIADRNNGRVRVVCKTTGTYFGVAMTANNIYTVAGTTSGLSGDGAAATAAQLSDPRGVAFDATGNLVIADSGNGRVRVVCRTSGTYFGVAMTANNIYTVAGTTAGVSGDGGAATAAQMGSVAGLAIDTAGNVYVSDRLNHRIRKITP